MPKYYTNLDELEMKLKAFSFRVTKDQCLDLPPKVYMFRDVHLNLEQKNIYETLRKKARAIIADDTVSFANKLVEILRLHQICNGFLKTDSGQYYSFKNIPALGGSKMRQHECREPSRRKCKCANTAPRLSHDLADWPDLYLFIDADGSFLGTRISRSEKSNGPRSTSPTVEFSMLSSA